MNDDESIYQENLALDQSVGEHYEYWLQEACELLLKRIGASHCLHLWETEGDVLAWPDEVIDKAELEHYHIWALTKDFVAIKEHLEEQEDDF